MAPRRYRMDRRSSAVEETRRKIVEATLALHTEYGIMATSWDQIAERAGVSIATVYRHYPSLNELVPACGGLVWERIQPPRLDQADEWFGGCASVAERVERLVAEFCALYERGAKYIEPVWAERKQIPALKTALDSLDVTREALVREALGPAEPDEQTVQAVTALTDLPVWQALAGRGIPKEEIPRILTDIVLGHLGKTRLRATSER
jgi:AcrR family transcriptional regulator